MILSSAHHYSQCFLYECSSLRLFLFLFILVPVPFGVGRISSSEKRAFSQDATSFCRQNSQNIRIWLNFSKNSFDQMVWKGSSHHLLNDISHFDFRATKWESTNLHRVQKSATAYRHRQSSNLPWWSATSLKELIKTPINCTTYTVPIRYESLLAFE